MHTLQHCESLVPHAYPPPTLTMFDPSVLDSLKEKSCASTRSRRPAATAKPSSNSDRESKAMMVDGGSPTAYLLIILPTEKGRLSLSQVLNQISAVCN